MSLVSLLSYKQVGRQVFITSQYSKGRIFHKYDGPTDGPTDRRTDGQLGFKSCSGQLKIYLIHKIIFLLQLRYTFENRFRQLLAKLSNWHLKRNMIEKMLVLVNRCLNLCTEKCFLSQIPITSQEMCSEQLECFPFSTLSLEEWKSKHQASPAHLKPNNSSKNSLIHNYLVERPAIFPYKTTMAISVGKSYQQGPTRY